MVIKDVKKFLESGGTQTDPSVVLGNLRTELADQGVVFRTGVSPGSGGRSEAPPLITTQIVNTAAQQILNQTQGLGAAEARALVRRDIIALQARERGRGFTRSETIRRLGGAQGVSALRRGTGKIRGIKSKLSRKKVFGLSKKALAPKTRKKIIKQTKTESKGFEKPSGFFEAVPPSSGNVQKAFDIIERERMKLRTEKERKRKLSPIKEAKLFALAASSALAGVAVAVSNIKQLPSVLFEGGKALVKNPKNIVALPKKAVTSIKKEAVQFGQLLRISPGEAIAKVGTEILLLKGTGKVLKITGKVSNKATAILNPKFKRIKKSIITVPSLTKGKGLKVNIITTSVKKIGEPLKVQAGLAGKKIVAVSAQADKLLRITKGSKRIVRKPIPGEELLTPTTKRLLARFDKGKLNKRRLIALERRLKIETKGQGGLLERSFFADPRGRVRGSRLGIDPDDASLLDILAGDVTFKGSNPQILLFEDVKVQKFPKSLKKVERKLKAGKDLTEAEANALLKFQLKGTGKFKPVGKLSREPEVTIAPGELIAKDKKIAVTLINGKKVPIVRAKIIKAKPETKRLMKKAKEGRITRQEIKKLERNLKKETGFKSNISRSVRRRKVVRLRPRPRPRPRARRRPRPRARPRPRPRPRRRVTRVTRVTRVPPRTRTPTRPRPKPRPPTRPPRRPPRRPPARPPGRPPVRIPLRFKFKKKRVKKKLKQVKVFNVFVKAGKQFKKVNTKPLSLAKARDRRAFFIDQTTATTGKIKGAGVRKTGGKGIKREAGYFSRTRKKFRRFKVAKGKKVSLAKKVIERKGKPRIDTKGEKKGLTVAKLLKRTGIKSKKKK